MKVGAKKKIRRGMLALAICFLSLFGAISVNAETSGNVPVTYTKEESDIYALEVKVKGNGEVIFGQDTLRNVTKRYDLAVDESMTFKMKPDGHSSLKEIVLNGDNITKEVENMTLTVNGAESEQKLLVEFQSDGGNRIFGPKTGDVISVFPYILIAVAALAVIIFVFLYKRRKDVKKETEAESGEKENGEE